MPQVSNLKIFEQKDNNGSNTNNFYATWEFNEYTNSASTSSGSVKVGDLVSVKAGATWYNGVSISSFVFNDQWYVIQVNGDRAVLGKNKSGSNNIQSPINTKYLSGGSGSSSSTTSSTKTLEKYEVVWKYYTGDSVWFKGNNGSSDEKQSDMYSPPDNALKISVTVKPISKTYEVKNSKGETSQKAYWTGSPVTVIFDLAQSRPNTPTSAPSVEVKDYTLTAKVTGITDVRADEIQFLVYEGTNIYLDNKTNTGFVKVQFASASYSCRIKPGAKYHVKYRVINLQGSAKTYSDMSPPSEECFSAPASVTNVRCSADSETSVKLMWDESPTAETYEYQYTTTPKYFDTTSEPQTNTVEGTTAYVTGLESGEKWYFRVRAVNESGKSGWSELVQAVIGTAPEAPTTWSLTNTVIVGDDITLYWVHNSEDKSKQTKAEIRLDINGMVSTVTVTGVADEDEEERIYSYTFSSKEYSEGAKILWEVRTKGIVNEFSEWSTQRRIDLYAPPYVEIGLMTDENGDITSFPLDINLFAGPTVQKPTSYHISITNVDAYESNDAIGSEIMVSAGTELFSRVYGVDENEFSVSLSAGDVLLENNQNYKLTVTVSMDSGLVAESSAEFLVNWATYEYLVDAFISVDSETLSAYITPYCTDSEGNLPGDVTLSVYRREYNGTFTEIITGLANTGVDTITDPHPSLDYARYRIVAQNVNTGSISYEDIPGHPIGEPSIIIQWDEKWVNFDYSNDMEPDVRPWTGSMLRLKYNVDINEKYSGDVSLIGYIGRDHPVSYYGTQRGESATWSTVIEKTDKETLYALRRLAAWRGDVYVREPSGTGYWAQITVSFPINHNELTIPVTFEINRVEGGV